MPILCVAIPVGLVVIVGIVNHFWPAIFTRIFRGGDTQYNPRSAPREIDRETHHSGPPSSPSSPSPDESDPQ